MEVVGADVQLQQRGLAAVAVKGGLHGGAVFLQGAFVANGHVGCGCRLAAERSLGEVLVADEHAAEELVLEGHPVEGLLALEQLFRRLAQVVHTAFLLLVGEAAEAVLEVEALLQHLGRFLPFDEHGLGAGLQVACHAVGADGDVEQVGAGVQGVLDVQGAAVGCLQAHDHTGVRAGHGGEVVVVRVDVVTLAAEGEMEVVVGVHDADGTAGLDARAACDDGLLYLSALGGEGHFEVLVAEHHVLLLARELAVEEGRGVGHELQGPGVGLCVVGLCLCLGDGLFCLPDGVLARHFLHFSLAGAAVPVESDEHQCNQYETCYGVFVHE